MASDNSSRLPLIPRESALTQQGAINWDNLVHRSVNFTVGVLNRCANAGVDPYSLVVGQAVAQNFPLAIRGHKNVHEAVTSLRYKNSISETLWFGFGVRALVRTLVLTDEGTSLVGLCATLSECFHEEFSAEVMFRIVKEYGAPGELTPSIAQWVSIIRACSGTFATSKFPLLAEGVMGLDPGSKRMRTRTVPAAYLRPPASIQGCPLPGDLAKVLLAIGEILSGQLESIYVSGCAAVGWIAAIAEWLFDLKIRVYYASNHTDPVYSNCIENESAQLYLEFDHDKAVFGSQSRLHIARKSFLLMDSSHIFRERGGGNEKVQCSGRVSWQTCLSNTFGSDFETLRKATLNFGTAIGCAARIFKAISNAETQVPQSYLSGCQSYFDASGGQGFVYNAIHWFPELDCVKRAMDEASRMGFQQAKETYEEKFLALKRLCNCDVCQDNYRVEMPGFCQLLVMETIISLCQVTSGLSVVENLHPMRSGVEAFYREQLATHERALEHAMEEDLHYMGPISHVLTRALENRLSGAVKLFTGRDIHTPMQSRVSAVSESGILAHLDILSNFCIDPESTGRVHVMPGIIEHDHRPYSEVRDDASSWASSATTLNHLKAQIEPLNEVVMEVTETAAWLYVCYILRQESQNNFSVRVGPADIVDWTNKARGLVHCNDPNRSWKGPQMRSFTYHRIQYPVLELSLNGKRITVVDTAKGGDYLRIAALKIVRRIDKFAKCILSDGQCIDCCLAKSIDLDRNEVVIIADASKLLSAAGISPIPS